MSSIGKLMKQAARMQQQMEQIQAQLALRTVEATSGGGAVKVTAKCDGSIASIKIDPAALNPADAQIVEDMILLAANQALAEAKEISNAEMGKATAGFNLPGLMYDQSCPPNPACPEARVVPTRSAPPSQRFQPLPRAASPHWMLGVGCWMLDVCPCRLPLSHLPSSPKKCSPNPSPP